MCVLILFGILSIGQYAANGSDVLINDTSNATYDAEEKSFSNNRATDKPCNNTFCDATHNASFDGSNTTHPVVQLLQIQTETCGHLSWCTINITTSKRNHICCKACSCDTNCINEDNCCPDYDFATLNKWPKYVSVSAFRDVFSRWTLLTNIGRTGDVKRKNVTQQCVRPQVQKSSQYLEEAGTYYMTSTCFSDDVDPDVKKRCEFDHYNKLVDPDNLPSFDDLTPVQSLVDGTIYKNKYCSACSSSEQETRPWTASVVCARIQIPSVYTTYFPNPNTLLRTFFLYSQTPEMMKFRHCNIIFEPSEDQQNVIQNNKCTKYDFEGCRNNTSATVESKLCERYSSPVHIYSDDSDRTLTVYKNAACLSCPESPVTHKVCSYYTSRRLKMVMFVPREMAKISATDNVEDMLYEAFPGDLKHGCKMGEIHDALSDICRKVVCPRGMFAFRGKCHNFFSNVNGGTFIALLRLTPTSYAINDTYFASAVYNDLSLYDENDLMVSITDVSVWRWPSTYFLVYLAISLDDTNATYADAINFVRNLLMSPQSLTNTRLASLATLKVSIADSVVQDFRSFVDLRSGEYLSVAYPKSWRKKVLKVQFKIGEANFCYRLKITDDEYEFTLNNRAIHIKSTGTTVYMYDITNFPIISSKNMLVCAKRVLGVSTTNIPEINDERPTKILNARIADDASKKKLEIAIVTSVLALFGIIVHASCKFRRMNAQMNQARSDGQELR